MKLARFYSSSPQKGVEKSEHNSSRQARTILLCAKTTIKLILLLLALILLLPIQIQARDVSQITDWYIKDFRSEITVNEDSSLSITEYITADCGNLPDKHGIFRILPTFYQQYAEKKIKTPVKLIDITDFDGKPYQYSTTKKLDSITWKIGDPDVTVTGENYYKISYKVENTVRFDNQNFDELYWNLSGNFWQIPIDNFKTTITFPDGITKKNTATGIYSGDFGQKDAGLASYGWEDGNILIINSLATLEAGQGVTVSVTFPKDIIDPYVPSIWERYNIYLVVIIPLIIFFACLILWRRFGADPKLNKAEMVQYEPPLDLSPMELGTLYSNGYFQNKYISAAIVNLAVKKIIMIEEIPKKGVFGSKDFKLTRLDSKGTGLSSEAEKVLLARVFAGNTEIMLSDLKNKFYDEIPAIKEKVSASLAEKNLFAKEGFVWQAVLAVLAIMLAGLGIFLVTVMVIYAGTGMMIAGLITLFFSFLMRRRTKEGAEAFWQVQGFKLFMTKAEKYRQQFHEKEGMFEKLLPYAMVFGITSIWINNMKKIYGEKYFNTYHPYWYAGYALASFNADSFTNSIDSLSNTMTSTMASSPSSSGSGGGGFSGGGGGGGGGGGW